MKKEMIRFTMEVPVEFHTHLKMLAAHKKISMKDLILEALKAYEIEDDQLSEDEEDIRDAEEALESIKTHGAITHDELLKRLGIKKKCIKSNTRQESKKTLKNSPKKIAKKSQKK